MIALLRFFTWSTLGLTSSRYVQQYRWKRANSEHRIRACFAGKFDLKDGRGHAIDTCSGPVYAIDKMFSPKAVFSVIMSNH